MSIGHTRNILKNFLITFLFFCFASCGFQVIYKENSSQIDGNYEEELAAIRIKKNRTKLDQDLKNNLYDLLNPDYLNVEPKYFLSLTAVKNVTSTFINSTGASGRNRIFLDVSYELRDLKSGDLISKGSTTLNDNYDVTTNRYATYSADEYVASNLAKSVAKNIRNSLVNDLIEMKKKEKEVEKSSQKEILAK